MPSKFVRTETGTAVSVAALTDTASRATGFWFKAPSIRTARIFRVADVPCAKSPDTMARFRTSINNGRRFMNGAPGCFDPTILNRLPHEVEERLQHPPGQAPDLVAAVMVKVRWVAPVAERDVAHLGVVLVEQRVDRHLEDLDDLRLLHDVVAPLVDDRGERRDEEAAVGDEVIEAAEDLYVARRNADLLLRLAPRRIFEELGALDRAAGK